MLHVVGNLCRDTTLVLDRFPIPGETMVARQSRCAWGGKGLNQAVAAARAGAEVALHAAVGADDIPTILAELAGEVWPVLHLEPLQSPTDMSTILVREGGENMIVSSTACALGFDPSAGTMALDLQADDILLMQGNLSRTVTEACLRHGRCRGAKTILNPSPLWDDPFDWTLVDIAVLNEGEIERISGCAGVEGGARRLRGFGVGIVVVTRGARGAFAMDADRALAVSAPAVEACDTSGAGDIFCGVLTARLQNGARLDAALGSAVAAAALSVTRPGALSSCPTAEDLAGLEADHVSGSHS